MWYFQPGYGKVVYESFPICSEAFFFTGHGLYTIFLLDGAGKRQLRSRSGQKVGAFRPEGRKSYFRYKCAKWVMSTRGQFVARAKQGRQKHPCSDHPLRARVSNSIFLTKCVKLAFLFVLHAQSSCFTHGVRERKLICACATFAHAVCKTATLRTQNKHEKASFAYTV